MNSYPEQYVDWWDQSYAEEMWDDQEVDSYEWMEVGDDEE